jgi:hypothetical protein
MDPEAREEARKVVWSICAVYLRYVSGGGMTGQE